MDMVRNYVGALKKGNTGAIMGLVLLLVLVWFLYKYFTKKQEGMRENQMNTFGYFEQTPIISELR
jgi:hypothetical protein